MFRLHLSGVRHVQQLWSRPLVSVTRPFTACTSVASRKLPCHTLRTETGLLCPQVTTGPMRVRTKSHMSDIKERGVYDERVDQHVKGSDVKSLDLVSDGKILSITWGDGKISRVFPLYGTEERVDFGPTLFHSVWLQAYCFCHKCRFEHTGQALVAWDKLCQPSHIVSATDDGEGCLAVEWADDPGHTGIFPLTYLKNNCYSKESLDQRKKSIRMTYSKDNTVPRVQYEEVMESPNGVYKWVKALNETGLTVMEGIPSEKDISKKICHRIADFLQHTVYGEMFDVVSQDVPINAAYTNAGLQLHMDQPMYESPPGIQNLHALKFDESIVGGDNIFVDLFQVAEVFREKNPEEFELLSRVPVPYETIHYKRDWPVHMRYHRPMFATNQQGELIGIVWHPHLMGVLQIEEELVEPFFEAYGKFYALITNFPHVFRHHLRAGEMVSFNNRRVLHGRTPYDGAGERYLQGSYLEISEFKSCVQVLSNLVGDGRPPIRVGDYDLQ